MTLHHREPNSKEPGVTPTSTQNRRVQQEYQQQDRAQSPCSLLEMSHFTLGGYAKFTLGVVADLFRVHVHWMSAVGSRRRSRVHVEGHWVGSGAWEDPGQRWSTVVKALLVQMRPERVVHGAVVQGQVLTFCGLFNCSSLQLGRSDLAQS